MGSKSEVGIKTRQLKYSLILDVHFSTTFKKWQLQSRTGPQWGFFPHSVLKVAWGYTWHFGLTCSITLSLTHTGTELSHTVTLRTQFELLWKSGAVCFCLFTSWTEKKNPHYLLRKKKK